MWVWETSNSKMVKPSNGQTDSFINMGNSSTFRRFVSWWFKVPFSSPSWRSLNPLKGSLNHPKKVTLNHQVHIVFTTLTLLFLFLLARIAVQRGMISERNTSSWRPSLSEKQIILTRESSSIPGAIFFSVTSQGLLVITNKQKGKVWKQKLHFHRFPWLKHQLQSDVVSSYHSLYTPLNPSIPTSPNVIHFLGQARTHHLQTAVAPANGQWDGEGGLWDPTVKPNRG